VNDQLLTYKQAARFLQVSEATLRRMVESGELATIRIGERSVRFRPSDLRGYVESRVAASAGMAEG
jgi:excisionase family DNA binding protein